MRISSKPGNGNKVHIYIDDEYVFTLYDDYWYLSGIKENQEITDEELASLKEEAGFRSSYEKGLSYLSMRSYSRKELFDKLKIRYGESAAERAINKLLDYGYLNDESYCREYVRYLYEVKKFDTRRINQELRRKGIDRDLAENTLKTLDNEPISRIIEMLKTKYCNKMGTEKERQRLVNRFIRMGYSYHDIRCAFDELDIDMDISD